MTLSEERTGHPYYMRDAIMGQPQAIARVISEERQNTSRIWPPSFETPRGRISSA